MRQHDTLFIGGDWVAPAGTGTIDVISPAHRGGRRPRPRRDPRRHGPRGGRRPPGVRPRPVAPDDDGRARRRRRQARRDLRRAARRRWPISSPLEMGSPITFSQMAQAPQPLGMLQYYAELGKTFAVEEERPGMLRAGDRPPRAGRRGRRRGPVERPAVRHHDQARPRPGRRVHDRGQARPRDPARLLPAGRDDQGGRHPRRASSTSSPPDARPASTSSPTPAWTRSPSPAPPRPAAGSAPSAASSSSAAPWNSAASPPRSSWTTATCPPRWASCRSPR